MAKVGRKDKDKEFTENINEDKSGILSKKQLAKVKKQATDEAKKRKKDAEERKRQLAEEKEEEEYMKSMAGDEEEGKSAYQFLKDLRWAYQKAKGRKRLLEIMKSNDKDFAALAKELMKIEASLMAQKMKIDGEGGGKAVYVIVRGLEKPPEITSDTIDVKQIRNAITPGVKKHEEETD